MDKLEINTVPSDSRCSKCARYQKQIARFKKASIEANDESVCQYMQYEDEIAELKDECSYAYRQLEE